MLGKKKKLPKQNPAVVMDPNKHKAGPYGLKEEEIEEPKEISEDLGESDMEKLNKQLAELESAKKQLEEIKEKKEVEEVEEVVEKEEAVVIQALITEDGNYRYVIEATYPLKLGNCEIKQ